MENSGENIPQKKQNFASKFFNKAVKAIDKAGDGLIYLIDRIPPSMVEKKTLTSEIKSQEKPAEKDHFKENIFNLVKERIREKDKGGETVSLIKDNAIAIFLNNHGYSEDQIEKMSDVGAWAEARRIVKEIQEEAKIIANQKWTETEKLLKEEAAKSSAKL